MLKSKFKMDSNSKLVVLTGAGISAESGLKTFRDNNGLWENQRVEDVATPEAFKKNPGMVWRFYKERYEQLELTRPNKGHDALVDAENILLYNFTLITQNIDGFHQAAGSKNVLEMHGTIHRAFCSKCRTPFPMESLDLTKDIPFCTECGGTLRPDIVWFGEMPYFLEEIDAALKTADFFMVIGTSGVVYPAAQFLNMAKYYGAKTIGVNLAPPDNMRYLDEFHQGKSGVILPELIPILFGE